MDNLKEFRLLNNLTQKQFAEKIGVTRSTYSCWELGINEPSHENRLKIYYTKGKILDEKNELIMIINSEEDQCLWSKIWNYIKELWG